MSTSAASTHRFRRGNKPTLLGPTLLGRIESQVSLWQQKPILWRHAEVAVGQVKIRGFRVELGEVETVLAKHPAVNACVVVAHGASAASKKLVAYFVPNRQEKATTAVIREFLRAELPEYMMPAVFMPLDRLPKTPSGKVDRKALPAPSSARGSMAIQNEFVLPSTPTEKLLAELFGSVLSVEKIGRFDNFFDLGGHSLRVTRLSSMITEQFKVQLPLTVIFECPVLASLAEKLDDAIDHLSNQV